jgi:hypothetical protein
MLNLRSEARNETMKACQAVAVQDLSLNAHRDSLAMPATLNPFIPVAPILRECEKAHERLSQVSKTHSCQLV